MQYPVSDEPNMLSKPVRHQNLCCRTNGHSANPWYGRIRSRVGDHFICVKQDRWTGSMGLSLVWNRVLRVTVLRCFMN